MSHALIISFPSMCQVKQIYVFHLLCLSTQTHEFYSVSCSINYSSCHSVIWPSLNIFFRNLLYLSKGFFLNHVTESKNQAIKEH